MGAPARSRGIHLMPDMTTDEIDRMITNSTMQVVSEMAILGLRITSLPATIGEVTVGRDWQATVIRDGQRYGSVWIVLFRDAALANFDVAAYQARRALTELSQASSNEPDNEPAISE